MTSYDNSNESSSERKHDYPVLGNVGWLANRKSAQAQSDEPRQIFTRLYSLNPITQSPAFGFWFISFAYIMFLFTLLQFKKIWFGVRLVKTTRIC